MISSMRSLIRRIFTEPVISTEYKSLQLRQDQLAQETHFVNYVSTVELNSHLKQLVKTGFLNDARKLFNKMPRRDKISWTNMISGYVNTFQAPEALNLFSTMFMEPELRLDPFVLSLVFKACGLSMNICYGELLHGCSIKSGLINSVFVGTSLLDMYTKIGKIDKGCRVFDQMPVRNTVSWTAIITGLVHAGYHAQGLLYFSEMWKSKVECDAYAYAIALKACADSSSLNHGKAIHTQAMKKGLSESSFVANSLSTMYNKCGKLDYGMHLFATMKTPDVVSWTTIITTYVQMGEEKNAIEAFKRMKDSSVSPNEYTFAAVISGCANLARVEYGEQLHCHVLRLGLVDYLSVTNSIVTMYSKSGCLTSASMMFEGMSRKDIVSWSTIIAGYCQGGYGEEAFEYLSWMRKDGPKPNEFAFASLLSVCGSMAMLDQGKQLHAHVVSVGLEYTPIIQSSLINMYSKCGSVKEASELFDVMGQDDIVSWTAMINGYAEHGYSQEAIHLFEKIQKVGLKPDSVTFVGILAACSHAGFVDLGFHYFESMRKEYQITPSNEHYGCVIDLLCRAGRLSDAERMIRCMPFQHDDVVWSTLLRACRVHGDVDCGKRAAEEILKLDPNCAATHITLANIYAAKGKWREAAAIRMSLKSKGVIKEPGWSWVKVKDRVSAFVSGDWSHPQCEEINSVLKLLVSEQEIVTDELVSLLIHIED
ncbi:putative pentatricopeptide repeat-containing protein At3g47840 [Humulus lupulus]|uniref:putative pentatricopeptide repeat-containing protein At3g47840 n=1 Tax=Humulus lupulus TaxID=3486 RepID=UPI002B412953|nr:putative pentatricopeptide repeat-containing protein At3g47840 [Humulus lupulus]XP_062116931.1 putative pentatricopeptide repeat-containing protein At3g47840 [Humulus lupulus]